LQHDYRAELNHVTNSAPKAAGTVTPVASSRHHLHNDYREELDQSTNNVTKGSYAQNLKQKSEFKRRRYWGRKKLKTPNSFACSITSVYS
jgi:hypothetical protein